MADKLDLPLDSIIAEHKKQNPPRRSNRRQNGTSKAPSGGVQKNVSRPKERGFQKPTRASSLKSSVMVSNLPTDVNEKMIKEYFNSSVGNVEKVEVNYGPDRVSRGKATVTFFTENGAATAYQKLNNIRIDDTPIKVEVLIGGSKAQEFLPIPKSLAERASNGKKDKAKPKSAADTKHGKNDPKSQKGGDRTKNQGHRARNGRPSKKTAEELDAEMTDYFTVTAAPGNENGDAAVEAAVSGGDEPMDEIL